MVMTSGCFKHRSSTQNHFSKMKIGFLVLKETWLDILIPLGYGISDSRKMHWQRVLRGLMHGFISEEQSGYFSHYPVPVSESYDIAINCVIAGLHTEESENNEQ